MFLIVLILSTLFTREEAFKSTELIPKLEPAFLAGLRCSNPQIRGKFFEIFDASMKRRLHDRLMYIVSSQNWEPMGQHYWIKQCIQLIFVTADQSNNLQYITILLTPFNNVITQKSQILSSECFQNDTGNFRDTPMMRVTMRVLPLSWQLGGPTFREPFIIKDDWKCRET